MIDLGSMTDKFSESGQKVIRRAIEESKQRGHNHLSIVHVFVALCDSEIGLVEKSAKAAGVFPLQTILQALGDELTKTQSYPGRKMLIADTTRDLFNRAIRRARQDGRQQIASADLFTALFEDSQGAPTLIMRQLGADLDKMQAAATLLSAQRIDTERKLKMVEDEKTKPIYSGTEAWLELGKLFSESVLSVMTKAIGESHRLNHGFLTTVHILWVLWNDNQPLFISSMKEAGIDPEIVASIIRYRLERMRPHLDRDKKFYIASDAKIFLISAVDIAGKKGREVLEPNDLIMTLLSDTNGIFAEIMNILWADHNKVVEAITRNLHLYSENTPRP